MCAPRARRQIFRHDVEDVVEPMCCDQSSYFSFDDVKIECEMLSKPWKVLNQEDHICLIRPSDEYLIDKLKVTIWQDLSFSVLFFGIPLPSEISSKITLKNMCVSETLQLFDSHKLCSGHKQVMKSREWITVHLYTSYQSRLTDYCER